MANEIPVEGIKYGNTIINEDNVVKVVGDYLKDKNGNIYGKKSVNYEVIEVDSEAEFVAAIGSAGERCTDVEMHVVLVGDIVLTSSVRIKGVGGAGIVIRGIDPTAPRRTLTFNNGGGADEYFFDIEDSKVNFSYVKLLTNNGDFRGIKAVNSVVEFKTDVSSSYSSYVDGFSEGLRCYGSVIDSGKDKVVFSGCKYSVIAESSRVYLKECTFSARNYGCCVGLRKGSYGDVSYGLFQGSGSYHLDVSYGSTVYAAHGVFEDIAGKNVAVSTASYVTVAYSTLSCNTAGGTITGPSLWCNGGGINAYHCSFNTHDDNKNSPAIYCEGGEVMASSCNFDEAPIVAKAKTKGFINLTNPSTTNAQKDVIVELFGIVDMTGSSLDGNIAVNTVTVDGIIYK